MYLVRNQYVVGKFNGVQKVVAEIFADTVNDLPAYNNCTGIDGELTLGTTALTADGKSLLLDSNGVWHDMSDGSEVNGA